MIARSDGLRKHVARNDVGGPSFRLLSLRSWVRRQESLGNTFLEFKESVADSLKGISPQPDSLFDPNSQLLWLKTKPPPQPLRRPPHPNLQRQLLPQSGLPRPMPPRHQHRPHGPKHRSHLALHPKKSPFMYGTNTLAILQHAHSSSMCTWPTSSSTG
jgi:hypothetical protein